MTLRWYFVLWSHLWTGVVHSWWLFHGPRAMYLDPLPGSGRWRLRHPAGHTTTTDILAAVMKLAAGELQRPSEIWAVDLGESEVERRISFSETEHRGAFCQDDGGNRQIPSAERRARGGDAGGDAAAGKSSQTYSAFRPYLHILNMRGIVSGCFDPWDSWDQSISHIGWCCNTSFNTITAKCCHDVLKGVSVV